jgi:hypothetical protein
MKDDRPRWHSTGIGRTAAVLTTAAVLVSILAAQGCRKPAPPPLACSLVELKPNPAGGYFDATIRVDAAAVKNSALESIQAVTPSGSADLATLEFPVVGANPAAIEPGDVFVVPLKKPDWRLALVQGTTTLCSVNFWDQLPPADQWHPTKSEAMELAKTILVVSVNDLPKPSIPNLPPEWALAEETEAETDNPVASMIYFKTREDVTLEKLEIQYAILSESDKAELETVSASAFLSRRTGCAEQAGQAAVVAGHQAVVCDMEGVGEFAWTYRYYYVDSGLIIGVDIQADPQEWVKTPEQKDLERRTDRIFLRYNYGPTGPEEWQNLIEIRMNRTGGFHKMSRAGDVVDRAFAISDEEFAEIESALAANKFMEMGSRSGGSGGMTSTISVRTATAARTVEMKNYKEPLFDNIALTIRRIVFPKVGEK